MLAYFETSLRRGELLKRTLKETQADNGLGLAAQLAYYFFLALFPALLFMIALAGALATPEMVSRLVNMMRGAAPPDVVQIMRDQLTNLSRGDQGGIMAFGVIAALWSSSAAMVALMDALNRVYDVEDVRPWWKQRLTAILLTLGVAAFIVVSFALVVAGPELAGSIADRFGLGAVFEWTWKILQWPLVLTVGGVMVLLLWLYLSGLAVIAGGEMNAEIEHASAHGKAAGEKVQGQRKVIGPRAARAFRERQQRQRLQPAKRDTRHRTTARPHTRSLTAYARAWVLAGGAIAALFGKQVPD